MYEKNVFFSNINIYCANYELKNANIKYVISINQIKKYKNMSSQKQFFKKSEIMRICNFLNES